MAILEKWGKIGLLLERQGWHYLLLVILLGLVLVASSAGGVLTGRFLGVSSSTWLYISVAIPVLHQVYVWFVWRTQLYFSLITKLFGPAGFTYYSIIFFVIFISRLVFITILALSDKNSLHFDQLILSGLSVVILIPNVYLLYSVVKYFGFKRALGIDHFDLSYRYKPLVRGGIFRLTSNAMYVFGLMILWIPGLLYSSRAALMVALFNHIYIWVHYYTTEKPDMEKIYGIHEK